MTVDDVTERLKEVGPYVIYMAMDDSAGPGHHFWSVQDVPHGLPNQFASMALPLSVEDFSSYEWDDLIEQGKAKYAESAK